MPERDRSPAADQHEPRRSWLGTQLPLETETARFVLASALDVFMTYLLIRNPDRFVEANPIALYFLNHWGVKGMVWFKFGMVAFVCVLAQVIARRKPETARSLLNVATIIVGGVVLYSLLLYLRHH